MNVSRKQWLFVLAVICLISVLSPLTVAAQEKTDLNLFLISRDYFPRLNPGEDNLVFLEVNNSGNRTLTNIRLTSEKPEGWLIVFKPDVIDSLSAGSITTVDVSIRPPAGTKKGEYPLTLIAQANEIRRVTGVQARIDSGVSMWLWIGIGIAAVVIAGFVIIYLRIGRQ